MTAFGSAWSGEMKRWRGVLLGLGFALLAQAPGLAADERDIFTVAAVPVDATAANANAARDTARAEGERRAYRILLDRLTLAADHDKLPPANDALLDDLVSGFEVAKERVSGVRYLANYTYHFRADAVRAMLRKAGIAFAESRSKPVVVLAVLQGDAGAQLWEDPNPWRDAWAKAPPRRGLVPFVVPYGELQDVQAIDADAAVKGDPEHIQAIAQRYGGADVLVSVAKLGTADPHTLAVSSTRRSAEGATAAQSWDKTYAAASGESDADLMLRAVAGTEQQVEEDWKTANLIDFGHAGTLNVRVPVETLKDWIAIRAKLAAIPAIQRSDLLALGRDEARLAIHYYGAPEQLQRALAQRDLALSGSDPDWVLTRRQAAPASEGPAQ
jgi:hypothetical protein